MFYRSDSPLTDLSVKGRGAVEDFSWKSCLGLARFLMVTHQTKLGDGVPQSTMQLLCSFSPYASATFVLSFFNRFTTGLIFPSCAFTLMLEPAACPYKVW